MESMSNTSTHHLLEFIHPILNILILWIDIVQEINLLLFRGVHSFDFLGVIELDFINVLEDFLKMRLHCSRFFRLRENL